MATGHLYINTRDELIRLDCSKIVYMEGDGNYTNIVLVTTKKIIFPCYLMAGVSLFYNLRIYKDHVVFCYK